MSLGVPSELLQNRPDIRQAERELAAAGLDIAVARANFYPKVMIGSGVGFEDFNPRFLFDPNSLVYNIAGNLVAPLVNKLGIQAEYKNANARQLQACYEYQKTILNAFTEVINRINKVQNYSQSLEIRKQQLQSLEASVDIVDKLFQAAQVEYIDVLFAQRDLADARMILIDTKQEQLSAIINTYQALGGGLVRSQILEPQAEQPGSASTVPQGSMKAAPPQVPPAPAKRDESDEIDEILNNNK